MLMPKKSKYRKHQRGKNRGKATRGNKMAFGDFGMQALEGCLITSRQLEAARKAVSRRIMKGGKVWIRIFPDHVITSRPADSRMGKGKGAPVDWVAKVQPGKILFELTGLTDIDAKEAVISGGHKLPCKIRFVTMKKI